MAYNLHLANRQEHLLIGIGSVTCVLLGVAY